MRRRHAWAPLLAASSAAAAPLTLTFPGGRDAADHRYDHLEDLLLRLLRAAGQAVRIRRVPGLTQPRRLIELQAGRLDIAFVSSVSPELPKLRVLRQPIRRGLLGLRLLLAPRAIAPRLAQARSMAELRPWRLGYGSDWSDLAQMQTLGMNLVTAASYSGLFRMLSQRRFDWMHRGVNEIWGEVDTPGLLPKDVVVVPRVALFYPLDDYFCVSPQRPELLGLLELGYGRLLRDGGYAQWFRQHFGPALARARLDQRELIHLTGYGVPPGTPLDAFDALSLSPARGELVLP